MNDRRDQRRSKKIAVASTAAAVADAISVRRLRGVGGMGVGRRGGEEDNGAV